MTYQVGGAELQRIAEGTELFRHRCWYATLANVYETSVELIDLLIAADDTLPPKVEATGHGGGADEALTARVASLERRQSEKKKLLTPTEKNRKQRNDFSCKRRTKKTPDTWAEIYNAYNKKYPQDKDASPDTLRLSHDRNCTKCREDKS